MTKALFPQIEAEIASAAAASRADRRAGASSWRSRTALAAGTVLGAGALAVGLTVNPASSAVQSTPVELARAVPALTAPAAPIPRELRRIFGGTGVPLPDATANVRLGRPIAARVPGAPASWVVPTERGACFALFDADRSISVSCASLHDIKTTGLVATLKSADTSGRETGAAFEIGVGGPRAGTDGSFATAFPSSDPGSDASGG